MTSHARHRRTDSARGHAELPLHDLLLRDMAPGGTDEPFDHHGYLQGLAPLGNFQQESPAHALNEALDESYRAQRVPLSTPPPDAPDDGRLSRFVDRLLGNGPLDARGEAGPPGAGPAEPPPPHSG